MWICKECGDKHGRLKPKGVVTTHTLRCDWCKHNKEVYNYRDYGYPNLFNAISEKDKEKELDKLHIRNEFRRAERI